MQASELFLKRLYNLELRNEFNLVNNVIMIGFTSALQLALSDDIKYRWFIYKFAETDRVLS